MIVFWYFPEERVTMMKWKKKIQRILLTSLSLQDKMVTPLHARHSASLGIHYRLTTEISSLLTSSHRTLLPFLHTLCSSATMPSFMLILVHEILFLHPVNFSFIDAYWEPPLPPPVIVCGSQIFVDAGFSVVDP